MMSYGRCYMANEDSKNIQLLLLLKKKKKTKTSCTYCTFTRLEITKLLNRQLCVSVGSRSSWTEVETFCE